MRRMMMAAAAALALGACGQAGQNEAGQAASAGGGGGGAFPNLFQTSYRAEAVTTPAEGGAPMNIVMVRSGRKMRMEFAGPQGQMATIFDPDAQVAYTVMPAQRTAMRIPLDQVMEQSWEERWQSEMETGSAVLLGPCSGAGENGQQWQTTDEGGATNTACVTGDGILLSATNADRTVWETTSVQRGPQGAENFAIPEGYNVMDLGDMMNSAKGMIEQLQKQRQAAGQ